MNTESMLDPFTDSHQSKEFHEPRWVNGRAAFPVLSIDPCRVQAERAAHRHGRNSIDKVSPHGLYWKMR
jgi:hypothetical protein